MISSAVILVGGPSRGTRFRPLSFDVPKPLFKIGGREMIYHHLQALSKVESVKDVFLVGFYEDSVFKEFIHEASVEFPMFHRIKYLREYNCLGTGGGLYHFRDQILKGHTDNVFVMHADVCCSFPLNELLQSHQAKDALVTLMATKVNKEDASNFGCLVEDPNTNRVLHYVDKPSSYLSNIISCGIYVFDASIFDEIKKAYERRIEEVEKQLRSLDDGMEDYLSLEDDVLAPLCSDSSKAIFAYNAPEFWRQIKTAGSAVPANSLYLQKAYHDGTLPRPDTEAEIIQPVFIHPSATVSRGAKIGPNVFIGARVRVDDGARIRNSIIQEDCEVSSQAVILHSILSRNCKIGKWSRVEGSPTLPSQHSTTIMRNHVKVQAITVMGADCHVHDEVRVQNCLVLPHKEIKVGLVGEIVM
ncbi:mannose-1-phosphate guanyltransferase [Schizosaccharomyces cryophilus OY26]|uniref:mannose-1-phosphate guanylyltransferase n=1 Tax=Schizosaccharomyces cryophilus (strain OY26 / ATCC MYA-4695 / CBS 11777 / NBRC 106824 / NRRL Y48691) TaxID=653667 RepID=S9W164_SCHCR|nr:mannose-1-phosphate guanyltransferase [Schizosaccharomyces cryophilus OY26]EPY53688.1 mannose-1-phosphate guanyltransferase [Schizosaccharomyces cryophilus OY26]